jgi:hypothetical protein
MKHSEHSVVPRSSSGSLPGLTLTAMAALVAIAAWLGPSLRVSGWVTGAVSIGSVVAATELLKAFVRQGELRGASPKRIRVIAWAVFFATAAIVYVLRRLWG